MNKLNAFLFALFTLLCIQVFEVNAQSSYRVVFLGNSYTGVNNLPQLVHDVALSAGDTLNFDSDPVAAINKTNDLRLAIQLILIPGEMPSIHYHMNPSVSKEDVNVLEVDHEFYMQFNPWKQPEGAKSVKHFKHASRFIDAAEFKRRLSAPRFDEPKQKGFVEKLKAVFS